ncbi:hypothetical protein BDM02DRAFT_2477020 [Thelephora ganbajun]|uniref:Uncharacterized protein n=1 Tax=Thelephora ganbajun TaxID=370292 RepID=A0ACB6YY62_THEGA|nr:hypothetical protein BDM02DRAFT_2477020 [Thelephora ganbajun]
MTQPPDETKPIKYSPDLSRRKAKGRVHCHIQSTYPRVRPSGWQKSSACGQCPQVRIKGPPSKRKRN